MQEQVDAQGVQLGQKANEVLQAAAEPIDRPRHHQIELALSGIAQQPIELRPLIPALSAADAVVLVDTDDLTAHAASDRRIRSVPCCARPLEPSLHWRRVNIELVDIQQSGTNKAAHTKCAS